MNFKRKNTSIQRKDIIFDVNTRPETKRRQLMAALAVRPAVAVAERRLRSMAPDETNRENDGTEQPEEAPQHRYAMYPPMTWPR